MKLPQRRQETELLSQTPDSTLGLLLCWRTQISALFEERKQTEPYMLIFSLVNFEVITKVLSMN